MPRTSESAQTQIFYINFKTIDMKRLLFVLFTFVIVNLAFPQTETIGSMAGTGSFSETYEFNCNAGTDIIFGFGGYIRAASGKLSEFYAILDGEKIVSSSWYLESFSEEMTYRVKSSGHHTLRVVFALGSGSKLRDHASFSVKLRKSLSTEDGMFFQLNTDNTLTLVYPYLGETNVLSIPSEVSIPFEGDFVVTNIEDSAFIYNDKMEYASLPSTIKNVGSNAFKGCVNLRKVHIFAMQAPKPGEGAFPEGLEIHVFPNSKWYDANVWDPYVVLNDLHEDPYNINDNWECYSFIPPVESSEISYTRTFKNTAWEPLYLPFSFKFSSWNNFVDIARINNIHQYDDDEDGIIDRTELEVILVKGGEILPNTPYVIRAKQPGELCIKETNFNMVPTSSESIECSSTSVNYSFKGYYREQKMDELNKNDYVVEGGNLISAAMNDESVSCFRWVMSAVPKNGSAILQSKIKIICVGETDGIESVIHEENNKKYDLHGRKLSYPINRVFISNGKKYIVK